MTSKLYLSLRTMILISALGTSLFAAPADSSCEDFLATLHEKPGNLIFLGCKRRTDLQGEPREATYRVPGSHAAHLENYLVRELKIRHLNRTCCVWESVDNSYRDKQGRLFVITMSTDETEVSSRHLWKKIPYFYLKVDGYSEAP